MDIDEFLNDPFEVASATRRDLPQDDLQSLTRAWVNERGAPELLSYELLSAAGKFA